MKHMMHLVFTTLGDVIREQTRRRCTAQGVGDEKFLDGLIHKPTVESLQLKSHSLDPWGASCYRLFQQTNKRFVVRFNCHFLSINILPESQQAKLNRQQLLFYLTLTFLSLSQ
jgi:hypothetical protein